MQDINRITLELLADSLGIKYREWIDECRIRGVQQANFYMQIYRNGKKKIIVLLEDSVELNIKDSVFSTDLFEIYKAEIYNKRKDFVKKINEYVASK